MAFGELLREKRLEHGWTKEYIAERTNLMTRIIEALETEDFKRLQPPPYTRGHIRLYCDILGIDPQAVIDGYTTALRNPAPARTVTRPRVQDLPRRPLEPIHTGAHRTFPPNKEEAELEKQDPALSPHRFVDRAEASFTSVPKPVDVPRPADIPAPAPAPAPAPEPAPDTLFQFTPDPPPAPEPEPCPAPEPAPEPEPFTLSGDSLPAAPAGRAALAELGELAAKPPRREVQSTLSEVPKTVPLSGSGRSIFGPQRPVPNPPNPQIDTLCTGATRLKDGVNSLITGLTRPKVRRMTDDSSEPLLNRRVLLRTFTCFGVLLVLTFLVFTFRYVFKMSATAEPEVMTPTATEAFSPRPVALPPPPYFKQ